VSKPPLAVYIGNFDLTGGGIQTTVLPGTKWNSFGRGTSVSDVQNLVAAFNSKYGAKLSLPAGFDNGDSLISQDVRLTRILRFREKYQLQLIGEVFNLFNKANHAGYTGDLNNKTFGQPSNYASGVFGTGGPRAFQFAAKVQF